MAAAQSPPGGATGDDVDGSKGPVVVGRARTVRRDRDPAGRARNSRPRDALGRPLPYGSADVPRAPEGISRTPEETITQAQQLLDDGLPFHAHEVFEDAWKTAGTPGSAPAGTAPDDSPNASPSAAADRGLWKGLAQLAVGLTHLARGNNNRGAQTLLRRGATAIGPYRQQQPYGLDIGGIVGWATELADRLGGDDQSTGGSTSWTAPRLRVESSGAMPRSG